MDGWWSRWRHRLTGLVRRRRIDREIREEMEYHVERETRELIARGLDPREARRRARLDFGGVTRYRQLAADQRWGAGLLRFAADVRFAARSLMAAPVFTTTVVVTLALGIGAAAAVYSVTEAVWLQSLPYPDAQRVVRIVPSWHGQEDGRTSPAEYLDYREHLESFTSVGVYSFGSTTLTGRGEPRRLATAFISVDTLSALGVEPRLGRAPRRADVDSAEPAVLVSDAFWRRGLGADPAIVGDTLEVDGARARLIGVLPPGFRLPEDILSSTDRDLYVAFEIEPREVSDRGSHYLGSVARIAPGVEAADANAEVAALGEWMVRTYPDDAPRGLRLRAEPVAELVVGPVRPAATLVATAVGFLLLVTAANVAGLLLSRAENRRSEFAVRVALGAGRRRLLSMSVAESLLLALGGGGLGILLAAWGTKALVTLQPVALPRLSDVTTGGSVVAFAAVLALLVGLLLGLAQTWGLRPERLARSLREGGRGGSDSARADTLRRHLVVAEVAVAVALLVGAGLLGRSFARALAVDPGFDPRDVVTGRVALPGGTYATNAEIVRFYDGLVEELRGSTIIDEAGAVTNLPLATGLGDLNFRIEGRELPEDGAKPRGDWQVVTPGYLEAMRIPLLRGRTIDESDHAAAAGAVVISESLAERYWPDEDPLGARFLLGGGSGPGWVEVVGIVADVAHEALTSTPNPQMYLPHAQFRFWGSGEAVSSMTLAARSAAPVARVESAMREAVRRIDPRLPLWEVRPMLEVRSRSLATPRLLTALLVVFSASALLLAAVGTYGLIAYNVGLRRREIGIRLALGATPGRVGRRVLGQGLRLVSVGVALGLVVALALGRALGRLLFGVSPFDPATLAAVVALLGLVALAATWIPAARAMRWSPVRLLGE